MVEKKKQKKDEVMVLDVHETRLIMTHCLFIKENRPMINHGVNSDFPYNVVHVADLSVKVCTIVLR